MAEIVENNDPDPRQLRGEEMWNFLSRPPHSVHVDLSLRSVLQMMGYDNLQSLQAFEEKDFQCVEAFMSTTFLKFLRAKHREEEEYSKSLETYFGIFAFSPQDYKILGGFRCSVLAAAAVAKTLLIPGVVLPRASKKVQETAPKSNASKTLEDMIPKRKQELEKNLVKGLRKNNSHLLPEGSEDNPDVESLELVTSIVISNDQLVAKVKCPDTNCRTSVTVRKYGSAWNLYNFNRHISKDHPGRSTSTRQLPVDEMFKKSAPNSDHSSPGHSQGTHEDGGQAPQSSIKQRSIARRDFSVYSRTARLQHKLQGAAANNHKIDEYFPILNKMDLLLQENEYLRKCLKTVMRGSKITASDTNMDTNSNSAMLKLLLECAKFNADKLPGGRRYKTVVKELACYLFILGGLAAYEFLAANLPFPSVSTVRRMIFSTEKIPEGVFRFDALDEFLTKRNYPKCVVVSSDCTVVNGHIHYDPRTNQIVGFPLPLDVNGLPVPNSFPATSAVAIKRYFENNKASNNILVVMARPLSVSARPFCLALYGTDSKFTSDSVANSMDYIYEECRRRNIHAVAMGSDGDPRYLKAMLLKTVSKVSEQWPWFNGSVKSPEYICVQDTIHILVKLKSRLLKPSGVLPYGKFVVAKGHIQELIGTQSKDLHELTMSFMNPKDKMNFKAAQKICDSKVSSLLRLKIHSSEASATYLDMMREIMLCFLDPHLKPLERIRFIWKWVFFLRIHRQWIIQSDGYNLANNFITSNTYSCVEINAHSLIQAVKIFRDSENHNLFLPWLLSSQDCEDFFRKLRSLTGMGSSMTTFSVSDAQSRVRRIDMLSDFQSSLEKSDIVFPRAKKAAKKQEELSFNLFLPEDYEIEEAVLDAYRETLQICRKLGVKHDCEKYPPLCSLSSMSLKENVTSNHDDDDDVDDNQLTDMYDPDDDNQDAFIVDESDHQNLIEDLEVVTSGQLGLRTFDVQVTPTCPFLQVKDEEGKTFVIRKSSYVWLLNSGDTKISSDRLQRVKTNPVNHKVAVWSAPSAGVPAPSVEESVFIGDWCAFREEKDVFIGRIVSFSYMTGKSQKDKEYSSLSAGTSASSMDSRDIGCLCDWYSLKGRCLHRVPMDVHGYYSLKQYICTVPKPVLRGSTHFLNCTLNDISKVKN